jgi:hypothetical protein
MSLFLIKKNFSKHSFVTFKKEDMKAYNILPQVSHYLWGILEYNSSCFLKYILFGNALR